LQNIFFFLPNRKHHRLSTRELPDRFRPLLVCPLSGCTDDLPRENIENRHGVSLHSVRNICMPLQM